MKSDIARARWWWAYFVAFFVLLVLDTMLLLWRPFPARLPEQFSAAYLRLYITDAPENKPVVAFFGDSVLWGYEIAPAQTAVARLQRDFPAASLLNLSYEGGSPANDAIALRYLLQVRRQPAAVVIDLNSKEFSAIDSAYKTLHPALEQAAYPLLTGDDRRMLQLHTPEDLNGKLGRFMEQNWRLYGLRVDLREQIFGTDDLATSLLNAVQHLTGTAASRERAHRPTPDRFLGTYDLAPIGPANIAWQYYSAAIRELCARHIPAIIFLTPTNHHLLHDYIDVPAYDANLRRLMSLPHCASVTILNLDRAVPWTMFLDNDHLDEQGQQILAARLAPYLRRLIK
jgi:lysophospholipase L1-like esterase